MDKTPVYKYPASYARENDELELYRASYKANVACKDAIESAISEHYADNRLDKAGAAQIIKEYGFDRTFHVLANTVREKDWDGRFSHDNKDWAKTIPVRDDPDGFGGNRNVYFVVDRAHPALVDGFINQVRHEHLLRQPLTQQDITQEAERILLAFQNHREPNSPNGTHFMVRISHDFLFRAGSKDQDKLFDMLPFGSLTFSGLDGHRGIYALITKDENRDKSLRQRKTSVRSKLQKPPEQAPRSKPPRKSSEQEL